MAAQPVAAAVRPARSRLAAGAVVTLLGGILAAPGQAPSAQGAPGGRRADPLPAGLVIPAVALRADPEQTYALYVPSSYTPTRKWPVLYAFDPAARGEQPIQCFRAAAEKLGYVLAASNVSRNGPLGASLRAGLAMMRDTLERFAIDERRLYATGFSGGARVASAIGIMQEGRVAGVIGCGGGFPVGEEPKAATPFAFCGVVGNEDFNWTEMSWLDRRLASLGKPHRLLRFAGRHAWPPAEIAMAAVEWLELESMRAGTRTKDDDLVNAWLQRDLARARSDEAGGATHAAWRQYADLAMAYRGLAPVEGVAARAAALQGQDAVKQAIKRERDEEQRELRQRGEVASAVGQLSDADRQVDATRRLHSLIGFFTRDEQNPRTPPDRLLARRLIEFTSITAYYAGEPLFASGDYASAAACFEVQAAVHPESPAVHYRIAVANARAGNRAKALEALKKAADTGFSDAARLEQEAGFEKLRSDERYRRLVEAVRANKPSR